MNHITTKTLSSYKIVETNGELGEVDDIYFDDRTWTVRYLVLDTNRWLPGGKVLLSPASISGIDVSNHSIHVTLTQEQVRNCPGIEEKLTVSRQMEKILAEYYGWPAYWALPTLPPASLAPTQYPGLLAQEDYAAVLEKINSRRESGELTLRSTNEVKGYSLTTAAQEKAKVEDFIVNVQKWEIPYLIVAKGGWLSREGVAVPTLFVDDIDWASRAVSLLVAGKSVAEAPRVSFEGIANEAEERLLKHYLDECRREVLGIPPAQVSGM